MYIVIAWWFLAIIAMMVGWIKIDTFYIICFLFYIYMSENEISNSDDEKDDDNDNNVGFQK